MVEELLKARKDRSLVMAFMRDLAGPRDREPHRYLAHQELRLEATHRPALHASYTESVRGELDFGMRFHREAGLPGVTAPEGLMERIVETIVPEP